MGSLEGFFESRDTTELLELVSKLPPEDVLGYLLSTSKRVLAVYATMRDSLPRGYGRVKFSRFVEAKGRQVEELCRITLKLYPQALSSETSGEDVKVSLSTVGDYLDVLREAVKLEELQLRAARYLAGKVGDSDMRAILEDLSAEIEENISLLKKELERAENFDRKAKFSDFVKELVGDRDGRV
ncbi:Rubrerythrin subfamily [Thermococcus nautili]|uniref:hypothetical protein n=1 Tax=Thermococcus nautili TaxID=195522 RepID=UPI002554908C|nr:hypothetical protein [Thermococcus nautili]CAI1492893.1 Rubrerythrin subfamily [Thermococcus nautili]